MIKHVKYIGSIVKKSYFENFEVKSDRGLVKYEIKIQDVKVDDVDEEGDVAFLLPVSVSFKGLDEKDSEEEGEVVFQCEQRLELDFYWFIADEGFDLVDMTSAVEELIDKNEWYFINLIENAVKSSLEKLLSDTNFSKVPVSVYGKVS